MKKQIMILLAIMALFLAACSNSGTTSNSDWNTGTDALQMSFVTNNPPSVVRGDTMKVAVEYSNKGSYTIDQARFYLHGYDPNILFGGSSQTHTSTRLEGKSQFNSLGSQTYFAEWQSNINSPTGNEAYPQLLSVTACYPYQTTAEANMCINPQANDYDQVAQGGCTPGVEGLGSSQGAPVAVTGIKEVIDNNMIYLEITVQNKGAGTPYVRSAGLNDCYKLDINDKNTLTARVSLSDGQFTCEPQTSYGRVRLDSSGTGTIYCQRQNPFSTYTITPIKVELMYNYAQNIQKKIEIDR